MTFNFMISQHFSKNFVPGLYEPQHALKLFQSLFIASPLGIGKYLLPFLLQAISKSDIHKYRPLCSSPPALMVRFKTLSTAEVTCAPNGLFCGLVASLMTTHKWMIKQTNNKTDCMARNVVKLTNDNLPGILTLINMQDFFEVHVETEERMLPKLCPILHKMVFCCTNAVLKRFRYIDCTPVLAYQCPCNPEPHPAEPKEFFGFMNLRCTKSNSDQEWNKKCELWGQSVTSSTPDTESETSVPTPDTSTRSNSSPNRAQRSLDSVSSKLDNEPTLAELSHFNTKKNETVEIILSLAPKWQDFATQLDFDAEGRYLQLFVAERHGPIESCRNVLMHWLAGNGKQPSTWRTLISLLRSVGENNLALKLETDLC